MKEETSWPTQKTVHAKLCKDHQVAAERYVVDRTTAYAAFQNLTEAYEEAKKAVISSGALKVDQDGKIKAGWYKSNAVTKTTESKAASNPGVVATGVVGGIGGIAGAIGAPAAAWDVSRNIWNGIHWSRAIGGLSGAAATSATAAWFGGGAVAAGGLGMVAAPFVLSGIGIVAGVGILAVAALIGIGVMTGTRKRCGTRMQPMREAERRMTVNASTLKNLEGVAKRVSNQIIKATGLLEANKSDEAVTCLDQASTEAEQLFVELQKELPHTRLHIGRPSPIKSVQTTATRNSISMSWKDPDGGNSEIKHYNIWCLKKTRILGRRKVPDDNAETGIHARWTGTWEDLQL